ncbi:MAG: carboxypeptidase-like regulatory domain-containing protein [Acidobacteriota bacterium]
MAAGLQADSFDASIDRALDLLAGAERSAEPAVAQTPHLERIDEELQRLKLLARSRSGASRRVAETKILRLRSGLERAAAASSIPRPPLMAERTLVGPLECTGAARLEPGTTLLVGPAGRPGTRFETWLRIEGPGTVSIDTRGSRADTLLEVFDRCGGSPLARDDDGAGVLQSRVVVTLGDSEERLVRVESAIGRRTVVTRGGGSGSITGTIVSEQDEPLLLFVELFDEFGLRVADSFTTEGSYIFEGLPAARFYVATQSVDAGFIDEVFDDVPCFVQACQPLAGTPILLPAGGTATANFFLSRGGAIAGRVVEDASQRPLEGVSVELRSSAGGLVREVSTDVGGRYRFVGLAEGEYRVVSRDHRYQDEVYDDVPCQPTCDLGLATPVAVVSGETTSDIDFELMRRGGIAGRLTDEASGLPVSDCLHILRPTGSFVTSTCSDSDGRYEASGIAPGDYVVQTRSSDYGDELYDDISCEPGCSPGEGTRVTVQENALTDDVDFALQPFGRLSGRVYDASTGQPSFAGDEVEIEGLDLGFLDFIFVASDGTWTSGPVPPGRVAAWASSFGDYASQLYDRINCPARQCDVADGTPIQMTLAIDVAGIDFPLERFGRISGRLSDPAGDPAAGAAVVAYRADGTFVARVDANATGDYSVPLPGGSYRLVFGEEFRTLYVAEVYQDLPCPGACDPTLGTPVDVTLGATTTVDATIDRLGVVQGTVTSAEGGSPASAEVTLYTETGFAVDSERTASDGSYSFVGLDSAMYRVVARSSQFLDEIWNDVPCAASDCDPLAGDPVAVGVNSVATVDFVLDSGATVGGVVMGSVTHPVLSADAYLLDGSGQMLQQVTTQSSNYVFRGLPTGRYFVGVRSLRHQDEIWDDVPCDQPFADCLGAATAITVTVGDEVTRDFTLRGYGSILGTVRDSAGEPASFPNVRFFETSTGQTLFSDTANSDGEYQSVPLRPGTYKVRADDFGLLGELYPDLPCEGGCDWSPGAEVTVEFDDLVELDFVLDPGPGFAGRVLEAGSSRPLGGVAIDFWTQDGVLQETLLTNAEGRFFYAIPFIGSMGFVSTDTTTAHVDEIYDGFQCLGGSAFDGTCDPTIGTPIQAPSDSNLVIDFELESLGQIFVDGFESGDLGSWSGVSP